MAIFEGEKKNHFFFSCPKKNFFSGSYFFGAGGPRVFKKAGGAKKKVGLVFWGPLEIPRGGWEKKSFGGNYIFVFSLAQKKKKKLFPAIK